MVIVEHERLVALSGELRLEPPLVVHEQQLLIVRVVADGRVDDGVVALELGVGHQHGLGSMVEATPDDPVEPGADALG